MSEIDLAKILTDIDQNDKQVLMEDYTVIFTHVSSTKFNLFEFLEQIISEARIWLAKLLANQISQYPLPWSLVAQQMTGAEIINLAEANQLTSGQLDQRTEELPNQTKELFDRKFRIANNLFSYFNRTINFRIFKNDYRDQAEDRKAYYKIFKGDDPEGKYPIDDLPRTTSEILRLVLESTMPLVTPD